MHEVSKYKVPNINLILKIRQKFTVHNYTQCDLLQILKESQTKQAYLLFRNARDFLILATG